MIGSQGEYQKGAKLFSAAEEKSFSKVEKTARETFTGSDKNVFCGNVGKAADREIGAAAGVYLESAGWKKGKDFDANVPVPRNDGSGKLLTEFDLVNLKDRIIGEIKPIGRHQTVVSAVRELKSKHAEQREKQIQGFEQLYGVKPREFWYVLYPAAREIYSTRQPTPLVMRIPVEGQRQSHTQSTAEFKSAICYGLDAPKERAAMNRQINRDATSQLLRQKLKPE